jgi:hypothetical protein
MMTSASRIRVAAITLVLLFAPQIAMAYAYGEGGYGSHNYSGIHGLTAPTLDGGSVTSAIFWGLVALVLIFLGGLAMLWVMRRRVPVVGARSSRRRSRRWSIAHAVTAEEPHPTPPLD